MVTLANCTQRFAAKKRGAFRSNFLPVRYTRYYGCTSYPESLRFRDRLWGQKLDYHVHLHCVVSGGGVNNGQWVTAKRSKGKFLFPQAALRKNYKAIFLRLARERKQDIAASDSQIDTAIRLSGYKNWKVYAKAPFGGPDQSLCRFIGILKYLGRYTHYLSRP